MSRFAYEWLALREPYDRAVRSATLADRFADTLGSAPRLVDLGCGTGANLRYLAPRMPPEQHWLCLDRDGELLSRAENALGGFPGEVRLEVLDLATGIDSFALDGAGVTASALLDLTSAGWLDRLAGRCREAAVLMALSFDGRLAWCPPLDEDGLVRDRFLRHQRTDKGFGPALGPDAAAHLAERLAAEGHRVETATSDWRLGSADRPLLEAMLDGVLAAAAAIEEDRMLAQWARVRRGQSNRGELRLTVGHLDLLALPG